jgi:DNA-binding MarR family transcriptional regulator
LYDADVTLPQLECLDHMVRLERPAALGELAARMACSRSNITQLIDRMERRGLVRRTVDPTDRRGVRAVLTREGMRRHHVGLSIVVHLERDLRGAFSEDVLRQLFSGLAELRDAAADRSHRAG